MYSKTLSMPPMTISLEDFLYSVLKSPLSNMISFLILFLSFTESCCSDNFQEFLFDLKTEFDIYDIDGLSDILMVNFEMSQDAIV